MPQPPSTDSSWAALIERELKKQTSQPEGDGWETAEEIRKRLKIGRDKLYRMLAGWIAEGLVESFTGTRENARGGISQAVWYRIIST